MIENTITHRPTEDGKESVEEDESLRLQPYMQRVAGGDCTAILEQEPLKLLACIRGRSEAEYARIRALLKQANSRLSLSGLDSATKAHNKEQATAPTHHGYAKDTLHRLTYEHWGPVAHDGCLYAVEPSTALWVRRKPTELARLIAEAHDGSDNCTRTADYTGIAQHAISLAADDEFFDNAEVGVACPSGFYSVAGQKFSVVPLTPGHRQRFQLSFSPHERPTPLFDAFMHQTFQSQVEGEEQQQRELVQEIAGAILLGLMPQLHKVVLFYDPYGRAGKGTLETILRQLVPAAYVTAVSPFRWDQEYFLMALAGSRLNVVGELPDNEAIPAAHFKSVTGRDVLTGRNPGQKPISFRNEAAHLFMSNHLIHTREHSEAFFARWIIVEFPNSLLVSGGAINPYLAERIGEQELPGIAWWALQGGIRLLERGRFPVSSAHDRLMQKWRRSNSSLDEFIFDECELDSAHIIKRAEFYKAYRQWCFESGRLAFAKGKVKDLLAANIVHDIKWAKLDGYEVFRGVQLKTMQAGPDDLDF